MVTDTVQGSHMFMSAISNTHNLPALVATFARTCGGAHPESDPGSA